MKEKWSEEEITILKYTKGHNYIKTGRNITVPILSTPSTVFVQCYMKKYCSVLKLYSGHKDITTLYEVNKGA